MKIGLIYEGNRPDWPIKDLQKQAKKTGVQLELVRISEMTSHLDGRRASVSLGSRSADLFDGFLVRGVGWPTAHDKIEHRSNLLYSLEAMGKPVMNPARGIALARDKERSLAHLAAVGFRTPETFVCEDLSTAFRVARKLKRMVVKPLQGSRGLGVILVEDEDSAFYVLRTIAQTSGVFYLQRYLPRTKSLRIFTVGKSALGCVELRPEDGRWKSNVFQGGIASVVNDFEKEARVAISATRQLGLWYAGVDLFATGADKVFISEVNASPSWRVFSKVTKTDPARSILHFLGEKCRRAS